MHSMIVGSNASLENLEKIRLYLTSEGFAENVNYKLRFIDRTGIKSHDGFNLSDDIEIRFTNPAASSLWKKLGLIELG